MIAITGIFNPHSPQALAIAELFYAILIICAVIFAIVTYIVVYALARCRHRQGESEPSQISGHKNLEIVWTLGPLLLVVWIYILTARAMARSDPIPKDRKPDLVIVGHQWWWEARYTKSGAIAANEIHIPVGQKWLVQLESGDVIHDFWAPELGRKMDMVPGHPNQTWLEADQPATYTGLCAEFCGAQHAWMRFFVVAQQPAEFEIWQQHQVQPAPKPAGAATGQGAQLFRQLTCISCHAIGGITGPNPAAPDLTHLAGRRTLAGGIVENTPANLAKWLRNPHAIKPGVLMPNLGLTERQAADLTAYLETLQ